MALLTELGLQASLVNEPLPATMRNPVIKAAKMWVMRRASARWKEHLKHTELFQQCAATPSARFQHPSSSAYSAYSAVYLCIPPADFSVSQFFCQCSNSGFCFSVRLIPNR